MSERSPRTRGRTALLLVDVINDFRHEDGERLLAGFTQRIAGIEDALGRARAADAPVVYANDNWGVWDGDATRLVEEAVTHGLGGELVRRIAPRSGDRFVVKPRYSAFDSTPLGLILEELDLGALALAGGATEMCVAQSAIAAQQLGYDVVVLPAACASVDPDAEATALAYLRVLGIRTAEAREVFPSEPEGD
jgi:nicotinamidase-related amidase